MSMNHITIHGRLGRDPELKDVNGKNGIFKQVNFTVAVSRDFGDETDWFYCTMNGKRAEVIHRFFHKGNQIIVSGRMESYKRKTDGSEAWLLRASDFDFCEPNTKSTAPATTPEPAADGPAFEPTDEDIPF